MRDPVWDITASREWEALQAHAAELARTRLSDLFAADPDRAERFTVGVGDLVFDWSRHLVTDRTVRLLVDLARRAGVAERIEDVIAGVPVNATEGRPVLHMALRAYPGAGGGTGPVLNVSGLDAGAPIGHVTSSPDASPVLNVSGLDVNRAIATELSRMAAFARSLRSGERLGATGRPIRTLVNLGIGGSHLGAMMAYEALAAFRHPRLRCRFVSNADRADLFDVLQDLDPAETLFLVVSKSFTTAETMANARAAQAWVEAALGPEAVGGHFAAVSADPDAAAALGSASEDTFVMWDWVGGRYSLASAAGLSVMAAIGVEGFHQMLGGMRAVDEHFASLPFQANAPVLMGLLAVWYRNFCGLPTRVVLPYSQRLRMLPTYLQQLEMESNGKRVDMDGRPVGCDTSPVVWGGTGTDGQHSFHQMLHQGTAVVPADFVVFAATDPDIASQPEARSSHDLLVANCLAQTAALAFGASGDGGGSSGVAGGGASGDGGGSSGVAGGGASGDGGGSSGVAGGGASGDGGGSSGDGGGASGDGGGSSGVAEGGSSLTPHRELPGNRPSTLITAPQLTPSVLGQLVALYEHQVLVQGTVWRINSFDQFGVEHGKRLAVSILRSLRSMESQSLSPSTADVSRGVQPPEDDDHDPATRASLLRIRRARQDVASSGSR